MNDQIEEILLELGFDLKSENSKFWRCKPIYRESSNNTSLRINKLNGRFNDFSANAYGSFEDLIQLALGFKTLKQANEWLDKRDFSSIIADLERPKISKDKVFDEEVSSSLMRTYDFYENRKGISRETLENFECGLQMSGKMNNRFVFVIRNDYFDIIGLAGRDLFDNGGRVKWKLIGGKHNFIFPAISEKYILEKGEVILVESIGDMLKLWDSGVKNVIVTFGVTLSSKLVNYISSLGVSVTISTNNDDEKKKNWGMIAAESMKKKLLKFLDDDRVKIKLPEKNDWGVTETEVIQKTFL